jgi:hypothetical protein
MIYPSIIFVSELLRTWETAILLFLTKENTNLTLFISPFLREDGIYPSDSPGIIEDQLYEFMRFLVFLGQLKKFTKTATQDRDIQNLFFWIPDTFIITFKHYSGKFTDKYIGRIRRTQLLKLSATSDGALIIECPDISKITLDNFITGGMIYFLKTLNDEILSFNGLNPGQNNAVGGKYTEYNDDNNRLTYPPPISDIPAFTTINNLNNVSSPPSIITFAKWWKDNISRINSIGIHPTVYFVSHSHIMQAFVNKVIKLNGQPSTNFIDVFDVAKKTNSWSLFFNVDGINFKGFRHAFSCDNRYAEKGFVKIFHRIGFGAYTNLALWGILSTAIFAKRKIPGLISKHNAQRLEVSVGMKKEIKELVADEYDKYNMLCGKQDDRFKAGNFEITLSNCGTSRKLTLTLDNDCIKIKCRKDNGTFYPKKVILQLSKTTPTSIQVKFFDDDSNTYTSRETISPPDNTSKPDNIYIPQKGSTSLLKIVSFLTEIPIPDQPIDNGTNRYDELTGLTLEMTESISNFIKSDVFKKTKNNAMWDNLFTPFSGEIEKNVDPDFVDPSGGGGRRLVGRRTKKMRKYKKYTKKYYRCQLRRKSRGHIQRRKRSHRRILRKSRK